MRIGLAVQTAILGPGLGVLWASSGPSISMSGIGISSVRQVEAPVTLGAVQAAIGQGDLARAADLRYRLHAEALASRRWETWLAAGDAAVALGRARGDQIDRTSSHAAAARRAYLSALGQARRARSLDGVVRAGEGFAALGDRDMVEAAAQIADTLRAPSPAR